MLDRGSCCCISRELRLDLDRCFGGRLRTCVHHGDVIDVQKDENAIGTDIEVRIGLSLCEPDGEEEGVDIVVPEPRCLHETIQVFPESHNDQWCARIFVWSPFGEHHIAVIVINIRVEKRSDYVQVIDVPSTSPDQRDEILKGS